MLKPIRLTKDEISLVQSALRIASEDGSIYTGYEDSATDTKRRTEQIDKVIEKLNAALET